MDHKIIFDNIEWASAMAGARSKTFICGSRQIRLVEFTEGFEEKDWCRRGHMGYVLDGEMDVDFSGNIEHFKKGDALSIPEGEEHRHKVRMGKGGWVRLILFEER